MPILESNIKFLESQVMDDVDNGGGAAVNKEIIAGQMNNVFEDISDLDRAYGRFNLRKIFLAVRTLSTDLYGGAKTVITAPPVDPAINYTLFTTNDPFDTRSDAANRVESYLHKGGMWHGALFQNHFENMRTIAVIQRVKSRLPPIGKTLCLVQDEGLATEKEQYVRVIDVAVEERTFTYQNNQGDPVDYKRWVVTMSLSDVLRYPFAGHEPSHLDAYTYTGKVRIRDTAVVDAAVYYGAQRLASAAAIGDIKVKAASIYTQLVPSAQAEIPLINQPMNPDTSISISAGTRTVDAPQQAHTKAIQVTEENRRMTWIETVRPIPAPGSLVVSYMAGGNWYDLLDDGSGALAGTDPILGAGTVDYATGSIYVTLGALPDADSKIMYTWSSRVHYEVLAGSADIDTAVTIDHNVGEPIIPGTLVLTWLVGGVTKTASGAANGAISGDATGYVSHATGRFVITIGATPDFNSNLGINYNTALVQQVTKYNLAASAGLVTVDLGEAVEPGSLRIEWGLMTTRTKATATRFTWSLGGPSFAAVERLFAGRIIHNAGDNALGGWPTGIDGLINYSTGQFTFQVKPTVPWTSFDVGTNEWGTITETTHQIYAPELGVQIYYFKAGEIPSSRAITIPMPAMTFRLVPRLIDMGVVPGSVEFTWNGKTYQDLNGSLYTDIDPVTGSGILAGAVDYETGMATISFYAGGSGAVSVTSLLGVYGEWKSAAAFFRAANSPLKPEALQVVCSAVDGEQLIATADANGNFTHEYIQGSVNYSLGVAALTFGKWVADSSLTPEEKAADWYNPANIVNGNIYKPRFVSPITIRYNAVAYTYLPLNADILGIEPVRLPSDGRVPIFRTGNVVMVMHSADTAPATVGNGDTILCGRTRIGWARVLDANGATVSSGYSLDRDNGIVTFSDVTGITMPVTVRHTVADLRLATDAQITGWVSLSRQLTHDYPAGEAIIASCLIHGDRRARVSDVWDQATFSTWSDTHGTEATATLNLIDYPITVTNEGCDTDRWVIKWMGTNAIEVWSEKRGKIWSGDYIPGGPDLAPINPRTKNPDGSGGVPYFTLPGAANGGGWAAGNCLRINTVGAISDIWIARAINQSDEPLGAGADGVELYALGNIDRP